MSEQTITIPSSSGYFRDVFVYLVAFQSFIHAIEVYKIGAANVWPDDDTCVFHALQASVELQCAPAPLLRAAVAMQTPAEITMRQSPVPQLGKVGPNGLGELEPLLFSFGQAMVTNYFERFHRDVRKANGGKLPPEWDFGRVVRNAMAHGGCLHFDKTALRPVTWRGLTYSPADQGKPVLHHDLWPGDLFLLLRDLEAARCPV